MITFLDNVGVHRVHAVLRRSQSNSPIRSVDALALLNLAEHIMFSEKILVPSFETPEVWETSETTISDLRSLGCSVIEVSDFTEDNYASACMRAAPRAVEILSLDLHHLRRCARLADGAAIPISFDYSTPEKWLANNISKKKREDIRAVALIQKSMGTVDFMVGSYPALHDRIREIGRAMRTAKNVRQIAPIVQLACFVSLNEQLASLVGSVYSPAPQRARVVHSVDQIFRQALEEKIRLAIRAGKHEVPLDRLLTVEGEDSHPLPLPMFAISFLRREKIASPIQLLESAIRLRDTRDVSHVRKSLSYWEEAFSSSNPKKRQKAKAKLEEIRRDLEVEIQGAPLYTVFRPKIGIDPTQTWSVDLDLPGLLQISRRLFRRKFSREAILLSDLSREFYLDEKIGANIISILGHAVVAGARPRSKRA